MSHDEALKFTCVLTLCCSRSNRPEELAHGHAGCSLVEANELAAKFIKPHRSLEPKRDGNSSLTVGSTQHHGVTFTFGDVCTNSDEVAKLLAEQDDAVSKLQADGCVNDVV